MSVDRRDRLAPDARALLDQIASTRQRPSEPDVEQMRAMVAAGIVASEVELPVVEDVDADGVPCRLYALDAATDRPVVVYFHGGGWVLGSVDMYDDFCRRLALASSAAVLSVEYRLAPEHPFPAAVEDGLAVLEWIQRCGTDRGLDPTRVAVAGDSAGGGIAAVLAQEAVPTPAAAVLVYPVLDATCSSPSHLAADDPYFLLTGGMMRWFVDLYAGDGVDRRTPRLSPGLVPDSMLRRMPPTVVVTAGLDPLVDEGHAFVDRLRAVGVDAELRHFDGMFHGFARFPSQLADAATVLGWIGQVLEQRLGTAT